RAQQPTGRAEPPSQQPPAGRVTVQDALTQPFSFTFARPTPIQDVAGHLARALKAPVALDRAALERLGLKPDDAVQLELEGVRLKTGLKLLLDQLDMTYRVEPEDNLLILTDSKGADDPLNEVLSQLKSLHRDVHDLQDALEELRADLGIDDEGG